MKKQKFDNKIHEKFKKYFKINEKPGEIEQKFYKKTEKYLKFIKWIPGIRMIGVGNSLSMNSATKESDIDLYIVSTNNSMWFIRILITFIFQILLVRKTPKKHAGRFCLSFFSTLDGMDFSKFNIENDIYLYFWILYFKPIINYNNTYELFLEKNNSWVDFSEYKNVLEENKKYIKYSNNNPILNPFPLQEKGTSKINSITLDSKQKTEGWITKNLNKLFKNIFLPKTLNHFEKIGKPYGVIINNHLLKFHNGDIREKIKKELL